MWITIFNLAKLIYVFWRVICFIVLLLILAILLRYFVFYFTHGFWGFAEFHQFTWSTLTEAFDKAKCEYKNGEGYTLSQYLHLVYRCLCIMYDPCVKLLSVFLESLRLAIIVSIIETVKHVGVVLIFIGKPLILICGSIWLIRYRLNKKKIG